MNTHQLKRDHSNRTGIKKACSLITVFAFIVNTVCSVPNVLASGPVSVAQAAGVRSEFSLAFRGDAKRDFRFSIPADLGSVDFLKQGTGPTLIHIQTAHGHYAVQKQIQAILHFLDLNYGIKTLLVEGSAFELDPSSIRFFPADNERSLKAADELAKRALIKGPELYLLDKVLGGEEAKAFGIEELESYRDNGAAFVSVLEAKERAQGFLSDMNTGIERLSSHYLDKDLRDFLNQEEAFQKNRITLENWLGVLKGAALRHLRVDLGNAAFQIDWPMMTRMFKIQELSKKSDPRKFEAESAAFVREAERFFPPNDPTLGEISKILKSEQAGRPLSNPETVGLFEEMVRRLPNDFPYETYPNVRRLVGAHLLRSELRVPMLMGEIHALTRKISEGLAKTGIEKQLLELVRDYRLLQKLFALELLPEDYEVILSRQGASKNGTEETGLIPSAIAARIENIQRTESKVSRVKDVSFGHVAELDVLYGKAIAFYAGVKERDGAMEKRIQERILQSGADKAVVITGGFHSQPFRNYFAGKNFSYALITPKFSSPDAKGHEAYLSNMLRFTHAGEGSAKTARATRESEFLSDPHVLSGGTYGVDVAAMRAEIRRIIGETVGGGTPSRERMRAELRSAGEEKSTAELSDEFRRMKAEGRLKDLPGILKLLFYSAGPATGKGAVLKASFIAEDGEGVAPYQDLVQKFVLYHTRDHRPKEKEKDGRHYHFRTEEQLQELQALVGEEYLELRWINKQLQALPKKSFVEKGVKVGAVNNARSLQMNDKIVGYEILPGDKSRSRLTVERSGVGTVVLDHMDVPSDQPGTFLPGDVVAGVSDSEVFVDRWILGLEDMLKGNYFTIFEGGYDWFNWINEHYSDVLTIFLSPFEENDFPKRLNNMRWILERFAAPLDTYLAFEAIDRLIEKGLEEGDLRKTPGEFDITAERPDLQSWVLEKVRKERGQMGSATAAGVLQINEQNENVILDNGQFLAALDEVMKKFTGEELDAKEYLLAKTIANELQHRLFGRDGVKPFIVNGNKSDAYNRIVEGTFQILTRQNYGPENVLPNTRYDDETKRAEALTKLGEQFARKLFDHANTGVRQELRHEANYNATMAFIRENRREKGIPEKKIPGFTPEKAVQYAEALIERKFVPAVDRLDILRMLRAQPATSDSILAYAVGDQDYRALQAALEGADILFVAPQVAEKVLREAKLKYPHVLVFPEVSVEDLGFERVVEEFARQRADGVILKPYAKDGRVIMDLARVRKLSEKYPRMVFVVAGGVRVENSREILALPSNVMVGAGFEMNTIDELRQNADLLIQGHSPRSEEIRLVERTSREPGTPQQGRAELRDAEELLYHVDEADNVLGSIARSSVQKTTPKPIFRTVQVIAVTPSGELVFQKRALLKKGFPGSMDFTSGHVIYGQDYAVSAAKEASEELPLTVAPEDLVRIIPSAQESFLKLRGEGTWQNRGVFVLPVSGEQTELIREKDRSLREFWDELYGTLAAKSGVTVDEFKNKVKTDEGYKKIVQDELIGRVGADNLANYEIEGYEFMGWAEAVRRHFENAPETPFADGVYGLFDARLNPVEGVEVYRAAAEKAIGDVTAQQRSELRADFTRTFQVFDPRETEVHLVANTALNGIFEADFEHNRGVIHRPDGKIEYTPSYGIDSKSPVESEWSELAAQLGKGTQGMTLISYHNIYYLDWFVAYEGKTGRLLHGFDEPYGVRTYSMFVQWNDGRVSSEDLTFRQKAGEGPDRVEVSRAADREAANPLGSKIRFAVFGQRLVQNGAAVPVENLASQFDDVFHLYRFPELQSKDESGGKGKFNDWFVRQFKGSVKHPMTAKDRPLLWEALKNGGYVTIDLAGLFAEQPALNIGDIKANALNKRGYTEVSERGKDQLAEGEYYIKENKLFIRLRPFPYPHDLIGITKSGKVVAIVLPGDKTKDRGYAIPRTSRPDVPQLQDVILQALPEDPIQDVFLLANSKDAFVWRDGAIVPELSSAKNYSSAPAAIAFVPKTRSEMRSPDEISPELAKLMAGTYLPQEIEAMPLEVKTQLLRDLMAGIPGRDLSAYDLEQKMLLLSGAPGSGKDLGAMAFGGKGITVDGKTLTFKDLFGSLLLYHSRMPRAGEINGSKYHFGHTDVGNPEKNRILRLLAQTGGDGQAPILEAYVNKQLQGVAVRRFVEKDLVLVNPGAEGSYDQILPTDENVRYNPDGTVTVDRPIVGLAEAFNANRLTYLEGGFHWFRQLSAKDPDIFTVFISSFSDEQLDLREKNQKILEAAYPGNPFKIAVAWNLLNVRRATQRTESIDLGNPEVYQALVQSVDAWVDSPLRTENPAEALKILGRKPFDKNGAPLDSEAAVVRNAELIESPQFIEAVNHLLRDYFGLDFRIDESNAARAKAIAYYVQKRLAESGRNDISVDLVIPTAENEKTGNFSKPQDMLNRVVEGIAQAFLQDQYSTGNRQGKGLRIVNEFAYGVLLAKDKDEIDRMINSLLVQHAETIANAYFAYVLNAINRINQMQAVANDMARQDELPEKADLIMVYGGGDLDGKVPASVARLYGRYAEGDKPTILLSGGGQGAVPEAETYRAELVKLGVPAEKILTETKSQDMDQNAGMSLALLEELGLNPQRIVFVHAPFHVLRGYEAAKTKFGDKVISVRAAYVPDFGAMSAKKRGEWEKALMKQAEKVAGTDIPEARAVKTSLEVLRGVRSELRDVSKSFVMEPERPVMAEAILRQIPDSWQRLTRVFYDGIVPFDVYEFAMQAGRAAAVGVVAALTGQPAYADGVNSPAADEKLGALTDRPETFKASPKFSVAGGVIGVRTGKVSDALILTPRFAFDRGAIAVVRTVFGDTPAVVVVRNEKDKNFVNELNQKLAAVNRPAIFTAGSAEDAIRLIEEQVARRQPGTKIKALVDASEIKEPVAAALIERLSDTMIVTQGIFQSFLNYAGNEVTKLINLVQAQFAVSRAA